MSNSQNKQTLKRKIRDVNENGLDDFSEDSQETFVNENVSNSNSSPIKPFWNVYKEVYDKLAESASEVLTTEDCIIRTRIVDLTSTKLIQEVQKLDLSSVDIWDTIASKILENWNKFFSVPENDGWSFSNLIPDPVYKAHYFSEKHLLLKSKNSHSSEPPAKKKLRNTRKDDPKSKISKPLEGMVDDKPLPLIEHMKRVKTAVENNCTNGHRSVEYLKLVVNPTSFSATVYNIFTISFMIREGLVSFHIGKDGAPRVSLSTKSSSQNSEEFEQAKGHFIIDLTYDEWKAIVKRLGIKSAMVTCPCQSTEDDVFYERFSQSQKQGRHKRNS